MGVSLFISNSNAMNVNLTKIVRTLVLVGIGVIAIDFAVGKILDAMIVKLNDCGQTSLTNYAYHRVETPIVIIGSSRANHHYVPKMIEDSVGLKTYNAGRDGQTLLYCSCILNAIMDRYTPKMLIWEIVPSDLFEAETPIVLKPYYHQDSLIKSSIDHGLGWGCVLMYSNLYRYNTTASKILSRIILSSPTDTIKTDGYLPLSVVKNTRSLCHRPDTFEGKVDPFLLSQIKYIVARAKQNNIKIVLVISPTLKPCALKQIELIENVCQNIGIPFLDNSQLPIFVNNPSLFTDFVHLNHLGAEQYTQIFIEQLHNVI